MGPGGSGSEPAFTSRTSAGETPALFPDATDVASTSSAATATTAGTAHLSACCLNIRPPRVEGRRRLRDRDRAGDENLRTACLGFVTQSAQSGPASTVPVKSAEG